MLSTVIATCQLEQYVYDLNLYNYTVISLRHIDERTSEIYFRYRNQSLYVDGQEIGKKKPIIYLVPVQLLTIKDRIKSFFCCIYG